MKMKISVINMTIPFVFWEFRDLDPLVSVVGRGILVGRFLRCLFSGEGVYGSSKELKDKQGRRHQSILLFGARV